MSPILRKSALLLFSLFTLNACAVLQQQLEPPSLSVTSLRILPSQNIAPRFEIGLHLANPNMVPLTLKGIAYKVRLEGHEIIAGVTSDLPAIAAYGEGDFSIVASADLVAGVQLISDLMSRPRQTLKYELEAKLDPGGLLPSFRIKESGQVRLQQHR